METPTTNLQASKKRPAVSLAVSYSANSHFRCSQGRLLCRSPARSIPKLLNRGLTGSMKLHRRSSYRQFKGNQTFSTGCIVKMKRKIHSVEIESRPTSMNFTGKVCLKPKIVSKMPSSRQKVYFVTPVHPSRLKRSWIYEENKNLSKQASIIHMAHIQECRI